MLCQQTSPEHWFANVNLTSCCGVTNSVYPVTITTIGLNHCLILEFDRGASNQAVAPGITRPLHATVQEPPEEHMSLSILLFQNLYGGICLYLAQLFLKLVLCRLSFVCYHCLECVG